MTQTDNFKHIKQVVESLKQVEPKTAEQYASVMEIFFELSTLIELTSELDPTETELWNQLLNEFPDS